MVCFEAVLLHFSLDASVLSFSPSWLIIHHGIQAAVVSTVHWPLSFFTFLLLHIYFCFLLSSPSLVSSVAQRGKCLRGHMGWTCCCCCCFLDFSHFASFSLIFFSMPLGISVCVECSRNSLLWSSVHSKPRFFRWLWSKEEEVEVEAVL